jgi:hypothetical protein
MTTYPGDDGSEITVTPRSCRVSLSIDCGGHHQSPHSVWWSVHSILTPGQAVRLGHALIAASDQVAAHDREPEDA